MDLANIEVNSGNILNIPVFDPGNHIERRGDLAAWSLFTSQWCKGH